MYRTCFITISYLSSMYPSCSQENTTNVWTFTGVSSRLSRDLASPATGSATCSHMARLGDGEKQWEALRFASSGQNHQPPAVRMFFLSQVLQVACSYWVGWLQFERILNSVIWVDVTNLTLGNSENWHITESRHSTSPSQSALLMSVNSI